jgi:hypothetical protein
LADFEAAPTAVQAAGDDWVADNDDDDDDDEGDGDDDDDDDDDDGSVDFCTKEHTNNKKQKSLNIGCDGVDDDDDGTTDLQEKLTMLQKGRHATRALLGVLVHLRK